MLAVRGERRLDGVLAGDTWLAADTLVLADAVRPASFLLRGLGIGDDRPGVAMPAGADGALPLDGVFAAGTCVDPRVDHDRSLAVGRRVGRSLAASLRGAPAAASGGPRWRRVRRGGGRRPGRPRCDLAGVRRRHAPRPRAPGLRDPRANGPIGVPRRPRHEAPVPDDPGRRHRDPRRPSRAQPFELQLDGRPRGLTGGFRAVIPIDLAAAPGGTRIRYRVELTTSGRLASFGAPILRNSFRRQVATLIANLEREVGDGAAAEPVP